MPSQPRNSRSSVSPARAAAFDILLRVERESSYAAELLHAKDYQDLAPVDHSLAMELVMGVLRWQSLLDSRISESSAQPLSKLDLEILIALRLATYQLGWLDRIPARAAINESVELVKRARKRSAASFVNAVLRKIAQTGVRVSKASHAETSDEGLARDQAHPEWLVKRWVQAYGLDSARRICEYDQRIPETAIRLRRADAKSHLIGEGIELGAGKLLSSASRVVRGDITKTAAYRDGSCVIQDEASQLVAALVGKGEKFLDCCAAPGGKTAAIADRNSEAEITAVELHPHRARLLRTLLNTASATYQKQASGIHVIAADARELPFAQTFDRVLADVPCSGTGTLARNPEIKWRLKPEDLADLQARQVAILRSAMAHLAQAGRLIYATCSLEREENEDVVALATQQDSSFRIVDCAGELNRLHESGELVWPNIASLVRGKFLRTLPGVHPCDGFFAAILEKN